jgi:hypothetical protein
VFWCGVPTRAFLLSAIGRRRSPKMVGHGWGFHINVINLKSKKK